MSISAEKKFSAAFCAIIYLCLAAVGGCSGLGYEGLGGPVSDTVELTIGDHVRVVTEQIEEFRFVLTEITQTSLVGSDVELALTDIRTIEVLTPSLEAAREKSAGAISAAFFITAAGLILLNEIPVGAQIPN